MNSLKGRKSGIVNQNDNIMGVLAYLYDGGW